MFNCSLLSKRQIYNNLWNYTFTETDSVSVNGYIDPDKIVLPTNIYSSGYGLNIDNMIITASHVVSDSIEIISDSGKYNIVENIKCYDIAVLSKGTYDIGLIDKIKFIKIVDIHTLTKFVAKGIELTFKNIIFCKLTSRMCPKIPIIKCELPPDIIHSELEGMSGMFTYIDDKIIGMITSLSADGYIDILPFEIIRTLLLKYNHKPIKIFQLNVSLCEIKEDGDITCLYIKEKSTNFELASGKKNIIFKKGDVIRSINGLSIDKEGNVLSKFGYIPYETYLLLCSGKITVSYYKNEDDKLKTIMIKQKSFDNTVYSVNLYDNARYYNYNGFIFTELNEELIMWCEKNKMFSNIVEQYDRIVSSDKIIVLVNIIIKNVDISIIDLLNEYGIIRENRLNMFPILIKIGNKKIKSLEDLHFSSGTFTFITSVEKTLGEIKIIL